MKRTEAEGNIANRYTEGDPGLGIPATVVDAEEMNNIQEELCNAVEQAGIVLDGANEDQLKEALVKFFLLNGLTQQSKTIANNSVDQLIANTIIESDDYRQKIFEYQIERTTDTNNEVESGKIVLRFFNGSWDIDWTKDFDTSADVTFGIVETDLGGGNIQVQVKYTSDDLTGTTYVGNIYFNNGRALA